MTEQRDPQSALRMTGVDRLIPPDHPIRRVRVVVDEVMAEYDESLEEMSVGEGRWSISPATLLRASVLMAIYSIGSEEAFRERLNYDMLFKWFLGIPIEEPAFDVDPFAESRRRLLADARAERFLAALAASTDLRRYLDSDRFTVDLATIDSWAGRTER